MYDAQNREHLLELLNAGVLPSSIDTTKVKDMSYLMQDITCKNFSTRGMADWNTSNVVSMRGFFLGSPKVKFDVSGWDVSSLKDASFMFYQARFFNQDISKWNIVRLEKASFMFDGTSRFSCDLSSWNTGRVSDFRGMFARSYFNGDISTWNVENAIDMSYMFSGNKHFNGDLSSWKPSRCKTFAKMFMNSVFDGDISSWDTRSVTDISGMFSNSNFFQDLSNWNFWMLRDIVWCIKKSKMTLEMLPKLEACLHERALIELLKYGASSIEIRSSPHYKELPSDNSYRSMIRYVFYETKDVRLKRKIYDFISEMKKKNTYAFEIMMKYKKLRDLHSSGLEEEYELNIAQEGVK